MVVELKEFADLKLHIDILLDIEYAFTYTFSIVNGMRTRDKISIRSTNLRRISL